jgi:hypothetical protein
MGVISTKIGLIKNVKKNEKLTVFKDDREMNGPNEMIITASNK